MTTQEKLDLLKQTKANIKAAIISKGVEVSESDTFASYADKISSIQAGTSYKQVLEDLCLVNNFLILKYLFDGKHVSQEMLDSLSDLTKDYTITNMMNMISNLTTFDSNISFKDGTVFNVKPTDTSLLQNSFNSCKATGEITINILDDSVNNLNFGSSFNSCKLDKINFTGAVSKIANLSNTFSSCSNITEITGLDFTNVTDITRIFYGCSKLTSIDFSTLTNKCTKASDCFVNCSKIESITNMNITNITGTLSLKGNSILKHFTFQNSETKESDITIDVSGCMKFESQNNYSKAPLIEMFNSLPVATGTAKILIADMFVSEFTSEELAIATGKGWTIEAGAGWVVV